MNERNPMFTLIILWATLLMSQAMIVLVSQTAVSSGLNAGATPSQLAPASGLGEVNPNVFYGVSILILAVAILLPRFLLAQAKNRTTSESPLIDLVKVAMPIWLVRWALFESIMLMGFCASMLTSRPTLIYPFAAVSLLGFVLTFPTEQKVRQF